MTPENNNNPFNFNSGNIPTPPAPQPDGSAPASNPAASAAPQSQTVSTLNVPFVSPTHLEQQVPTAQPAAPVKKEKTAPTAEQTIKKFTIMSIVFGSLALVFLGLSIWGLIFGISQSDKLTKANADLATKTAIISAVEENSGVSPILSASDVPIYHATKGYIYISEWGIKIKIPEDLTSVSYILNQNYRPSICFNAIGKGVQYFPSFANIALNPGGMGCLVRVDTNEGNTEAETGYSFGTNVFTANGYNYFYSSPHAVYSTDEAEQGLEATAVQLIKNMLADGISTYE